MISYTHHRWVEWFAKNNLGYYLMNSRAGGSDEMREPVPLAPSRWRHLHR